MRPPGLCRIEAPTLVCVDTLPVIEPLEHPSAQTPELFEHALVVVRDARRARAREAPDDHDGDGCCALESAKTGRGAIEIQTLLSQGSMRLDRNQKTSRAQP